MGRKSNLTGRRGGQRNNTNRQRHGVSAALTLGSLPKGASYIRRTVGVLRNQLEASVLAVHGALTPLGKALINSACRHETRALLTQRWLRQTGNELTLSERLQLIKAISDASDSRDRAMEKLGLHKLPSDLNPWDLLNKPGADDGEDEEDDE